MQALIGFGITGVPAVLTNVAVFVLVELLHLRRLFASVPALLSAVGVSHGMNYRWACAADGLHQVMLQ